MKEQAKQFHWKGMVHRYLLGGSSFLSAGLSYCCVLQHFFYATWTVWVSYIGIHNLNYHVFVWIGGGSFIIASWCMCAMILLKLQSAAFALPWFYTAILSNLPLNQTQSYVLMFAMYQTSNMYTTLYVHLLCFLLELCEACKNVVECFSISVLLISDMYLNS